MKVILILVSMVFIILTPTISSAQYLSYKYTLFGSLEFTRDGLEFQNFGKGWGSLLKEVESSPEAHRLLRHSRNFNYASEGTAVVAAVVLNEAISLEARGAEVDIGVWIAGGALMVTAIACSITAKLKLDRGFLKFNQHLSETSSGSENEGNFNLSLSNSKVRLIYNF